MRHVRFVFDVQRDVTIGSQLVKVVEARTHVVCVLDLFEGHGHTIGSTCEIHFLDSKKKLEAKGLRSPVNCQ